MAAFGAPVAHEDDAERAVRAGLGILEAIDELDEAAPGLGLSVRAYEDLEGRGRLKAVTDQNTGALTAIDTGRVRGADD